MKYRMIGIDLDGTLLGRDGQVGHANRQAIARAQDAGVLVVPCTGRAWREAGYILADIPGLDLGVFVTGATVCQIATGQSIDLAVIEPHLAYELVEHLAPCSEAVLVFREASMAGHDYLVTGQGSLSANTEWWFQFTGATVHFQRDLTPDDLHHTLRVGLAAPARQVLPMQASLVAHFGDRVLIQSFEAVQMPDDRESIHVLEAFAPGVDKWRGLSWIAQREGIDPDQIAAMGDEVNDVSMLSRSGCGIAMGNAADCARSAARYVSRDHDQAGVAYAIDRLLEGQWT